MLKTSLFIKDNSVENAKKGVEISIVSLKPTENDTEIYQVFDLPNPIANMGMIGVSNNQNFAIKFISNLEERIGFSVYLDGVNVSQKTGIHSLNSILEDKRADLKSHKGSFTIEIKSPIETAYLDRYSQVNDTNRLFTFTTETDKGINEILIADPTLTHRIEIYVWKEVKIVHEYFSSRYFSAMPLASDESKIGAGEATNKAFTNAKELENPQYLGKVVFMHVNATKLSHLGKALLSKKDIETTYFYDPMNKVPKS